MHLDNKLLTVGVGSLALGLGSLAFAPEVSPALVITGAALIVTGVAIKVFKAIHNCWKQYTEKKPPIPNRTHPSQEFTLVRFALASSPFTETKSELALIPTRHEARFCEELHVLPSLYIREFFQSLIKPIPSQSVAITPFQKPKEDKIYELTDPGEIVTHLTAKTVACTKVLPPETEQEKNNVLVLHEGKVVEGKIPSKIPLVLIKNPTFQKREDGAVVVTGDIDLSSHEKIAKILHAQKRAQGLWHPLRDAFENFIEAKIISTQKDHFDEAEIGSLIQKVNRQKNSILEKLKRESDNLKYYIHLYNQDLAVLDETIVSDKERDEKINETKVDIQLPKFSELSLPSLDLNPASLSNEIETVNLFLKEKFPASIEEFSTQLDERLVLLEQIEKEVEKLRNSSVSTFVVSSLKQHKESIIRNLVRFENEIKRYKQFMELAKELTIALDNYDYQEPSSLFDL